MCLGKNDQSLQNFQGIPRTSLPYLNNLTSPQQGLGDQQMTKHGQPNSQLKTRNLLNILFYVKKQAVR